MTTSRAIPIRNAYNESRDAILHNINIRICDGIQISKLQDKQPIAEWPSVNNFSTLSTMGMEKLNERTYTKNCNATSSSDMDVKHTSVTTIWWNWSLGGIIHCKRPRWLPQEQWHCIETQGITHNGDMVCHSTRLNAARDNTNICAICSMHL